MNNLYSKFSSFSVSFALGLFYFGAPLIYFFRDGLGLATNNMLFTVVFMVVPLFLVIPFRNFKVLYIPNKITLSLALLFLGLSFFCVHFHHVIDITRKQVIYETVVIFITLYCFILLSMTSFSELEEYFLDICLVLSFLGALGLLYFVATNPNYQLGMRASITFTQNGEENSGNPHIYSKGAFLGLIAAMVLLKRKSGLFVTFWQYANVFIYILVLGLTQAMSSILAAALAVFIFFLFNYKQMLRGTANFLKMPIAWVILGLIIGQVVALYAKYQKFIQLGISYIQFRIDKILTSFNEPAKPSFKSGPLADESADMRLHLLEVVQERFVENMIDGKYLHVLFGNGYKDLYVDVPVIEAFNSMGLLGFVLICIFLFQMLKYCIKEMRKPQSATTEFIAYGFIYFFVLCFTNGLIIDYNRWGFFALVCRFIPLALVYKKNELEAFQFKLDKA